MPRQGAPLPGTAPLRCAMHARPCCAALCSAALCMRCRAAHTALPCRAPTCPTSASKMRGAPRTAPPVSTRTTKSAKQMQLLRSAWYMVPPANWSACRAQPAERGGKGRCWVRRWDEREGMGGGLQQPSRAVATGMRAADAAAGSAAVLGAIALARTSIRGLEPQRWRTWRTCLASSAWCGAATCSMGRWRGSGCGAGRSSSGPGSASASRLSVMSISLAGPISSAVSCGAGAGGVLVWRGGGGVWGMHVPGCGSSRKQAAQLSNARVERRARGVQVQARARPPPAPASRK